LKIYWIHRRTGENKNAPKIFGTTDRELAEKYFYRWMEDGSFHQMFVDDGKNISDADKKILEQCKKELENSLTSNEDGLFVLPLKGAK